MSICVAGFLGSCLLIYSTQQAPVKVVTKMWLRTQKKLIQTELLAVQHSIS